MDEEGKGQQVATRKVIAEGSGKLVSRLVHQHHEVRVAIVLGTDYNAPMLELTENGYGDWTLVRRNFGSGAQREILASGKVDA
mgnify:CR=1 FL=1